MSELDGHKVYSRADGGIFLIPKDEGFAEWRATMWTTTEKGKVIHNDLCSPGTPEGKEDLMKKIERAKREGWAVSSINHHTVAKVWCAISSDKHYRKALA